MENLITDWEKLSILISSINVVKINVINKLIIVEGNLFIIGYGISNPNGYDIHVRNGIVLDERNFVFNVKNTRNFIQFNNELHLIKCIKQI